MLTTSGEHLSTGIGDTGPVTTERRAGDQLRWELLSAAADLAAAPRPVAIPSLRAVARACDVSASAVYRHFPSQAALTRALLMRQRDALDAAILEGDDPAQDPAARLRRLARAYVRWGLANPGMYQLLFESANQLDPDSRLPDAADRAMQLGYDLIAKIASTGDDDSDPIAAAERLWFGLHGIVSLRLHKPDLPWRSNPETEAETLATRTF